MKGIPESEDRKTVYWRWTTYEMQRKAENRNGRKKKLPEGKKEARNTCRREYIKNRKEELNKWPGTVRQSVQPREENIHRRS